MHAVCNGKFQKQQGSGVLGGTAESPLDNLAMAIAASNCQKPSKDY